MIRQTFHVALVSLIAGAAFGQTPAAPVAADAPRFEIADVHVSPKALNQFIRTGPPRAGRYEIRTATMWDLVRIAYGFDPDKILEGPSWLEMNRYDVIAKVPADATTIEAVTPMLQTLLADRFKLVVHKDTKPLPTWALAVGKKSLLKEADGNGDTGCKPRADTSNPVPGDGTSRLFMSSADGKTTTITLGPGGTIEYNCRNVTMESFVVTMRGLIGASLGSNPVLDQTGLKGKWNFDLKFSTSFGMPGASGDRITFQEAVEKQLGFKLEEHPVPTPVLVVDSVEEKPSPNQPGVAEALPPLKMPTEFDVADIKPIDPNPSGPTMMRIMMQPGGRFVSSGLPLSFLLQRAFNTQSSDQIIGIPKSADSQRYDITAKANMPASANPNDQDLQATLVLSLLKDRFGLKYHTEERPLPAYSLVAAKPKMKKADPSSRTHCNRANGPAGSAPGTTLMTCQNISMDQFAEQIRGAAQGLTIPPLNATEIEGGWDFALTWNQRAGLNMGNAPAPPTDGAPAAADPTGGYTIFEAIEKQLGLKLEMQKRPVPVYVIDHLDDKPTDN